MHELPPRHGQPRRGLRFPTADQLVLATGGAISRPSYRSTTATSAEPGAPFLLGDGSFNVQR